MAKATERMTTARKTQGKKTKGWLLQDGRQHREERDPALFCHRQWRRKVILYVMRHGHARFLETGAKNGVVTEYSKKRAWTGSGGG